MAHKVMTGARALIRLDGNVVAFFSNCSWSVRQDKAPIFILGAYAPVELTPTSQEAVSVSLSGFRLASKDNSSSSPYGKIYKMEKLQNLLRDSDFQVTVQDRQSGAVIMKIDGCKVVSMSSGVAARGVTDLRLEVMGLKAEDESGIQSEDPSSSSGSFTV